MKLSKLIVCLIVGVLLAATAQEESTEVFDLDEYEVVGKETEQPDIIFKVDSPRLAYYTPPELPKGEVILALDFIDRYKESQVPGAVKWASIITFPWVDGRDQGYTEWLCLYLWDGTLYGFSPTAKFDSQMRFAVPISLDRKTNPEELYALASEFVEEISPPDVQIVYREDMSTSSEAFAPPPDVITDPSQVGSVGEMPQMEPIIEIEYLDIPPGRIEGWRTFDKGKKREELVSLVYLYEEDPNSDRVTSGAMGPDEQYKEANTFWKKNFSFDFSRSEHPFEIARELLQPRWCLKATLVYEKNVLFFKDVDHRADVLLFAVGRPIFAYHPRYGVWRTEATLDMIAEGRGSDMITYPGVEKPMRVLLHLWDDWKTDNQ